jgi:regulator of replication initiation timing
MTTQQQTNQQQPPQQQPRFEPSPQVQAELVTLNVRYRDMQETMSRLITILTAENAELKTENTALKNQLTTLQTQNNTETSNKKQP